MNFTNGTPLRLRTEPDFDTPEVTQMAEGTEFEVIRGSACVNASDYYRFWQLQLDDGTTGWAAEANTTGYFIEPIPCDSTILANDTPSLITAIATGNSFGAPYTICLENSTYTLTQTAIGDFYCNLVSLDFYPTLKQQAYSQPLKEQMTDD